MQKIRYQYVAFMNINPEPVFYQALTLCAFRKTILLRHYKQELEVTVVYNKYLGDKAFRDICFGQKLFYVVEP